MHSPAAAPAAWETPGKGGRRMAWRVLLFFVPLVVSLGISIRFYLAKD